MDPFQDILELLPYSEPFLFVDKLVHVNENGVEGVYTFRKDSYFYKGHFKEQPITPGVILTECMSQIGVVCLGIFLLDHKLTQNLKIGLSSTNIDFFKPILPGELVTVKSSKEYFRFNKLKCSVKMLNSNGDIVCQGTISGMIVNT